MAGNGEDYEELYGDLYGDVDSAPATSAAAAPSTSAAAPSSASAVTTATSTDPRARPAAGGTPVPAASSSSHPVGLPQPPHLQQQSQGSGNQPMRFDSTGQGNRVKPSDMPEEGKMFIGGLNWDTTDDSLKSYFEQFGVVTHCTIMRDNETGRSRGFAFLTFEDPASVNVVMQREHYLDGKTIDPKRAIPRAEGNKTDKLFVRAIPPTCTQESFRAYWRNFGAITDATLMMDKESGRHRGFGFVNYESVDSVEKVLNGGPHIMDGQILEVKRAQTKQEQQRRDYNQSYQPAPHSGNNQSNATASANGGFDPQAMAKFFQQMAATGMNPFMMMQGGYGGGGMPGFGMMPGMPMGGMMPGMSMGGMGMGMPAMDPSQFYGAAGAASGGAEDGAASPQGAGMSQWTAPMASGSQPSMGRGRGAGRGYRGGFNPPSGPAAMRGDDGGAGPTRNRGGGSGYHPYSR